MLTSGRVDYGNSGIVCHLMAPRFVAPYRKNGKNDGNDAEAICEGSVDPAINRLRGLLAEFGVVLPQSTAAVRREPEASLEQLPPHAARTLRDLLADMTSDTSSG